ncbi:MAG: site-2 protease family protein, partial [Planctomycetota bacterium]|nr:site-2 protease family protein [Planctomycetota bacterium]
MQLLNLDSLGTFAIVVLSFSALIFVHELGHFLAARWLGVRVERFFLGFHPWGMAISKEINGCVYGIGILPLGGYVKLAGQADDPREMKTTGAPDELPSKPLWAQGIIFAAGVFLNFVFGYVLL